MIQTPIVDYISISVPVPMLLSQIALHINEGTPFQGDRRLKRLVNLITSDHTWIETKSSGRFNRMFRSDKFGFTYLDGKTSPVSLVQISGQGCAYLRERGWLQNVLVDWSDRLTRLDVAIDILTDTRPEIFARTRPEGRFKHGGHESSPDGDTWYVGRRTSDRHARVYRYNPPHPRSDFLRVEYELHDDYAKHFAAMCVKRGVDEVAWDLGATFQWGHEAYHIPPPEERLPTLPRREAQSKTERWILKTVIPALEKLAQGGKLQFLVDFQTRLHAIIQEVEYNQEGI